MDERPLVVAGASVEDAKRRLFTFRGDADNSAGGRRAGRAETGLN